MSTFDLTELADLYGVLWRLGKLLSVCEKALSVPGADNLDVTVVIRTHVMKQLDGVLKNLGKRIEQLGGRADVGGKTSLSDADGD